MPKKKSKPHVPVHYHVQVDVAANATFTYTAQGVGDASVLRPSNTDTISWSASLMGVPIAFQVEFAFSPFADGKRVMRSLFGGTPPVVVAVPPFYKGNMAFKYSVTLANGWADDPIVEPVPSDGLSDLTVSQILMSVDGDGDLLLSQQYATFTKGQVEWGWAQGSLKDDFVITFDTAPGFVSPVSSEGYVVALNLLTPGGPVGYSIQTLHYGLETKGSITIE